MAQEESPREDLLREATALVERIELGPKSHPADSSAEDRDGRTIVAGFRSSGAVSIFFGEDEVYHFNPSAELRRAYVDGHLYKAVNGRLFSMTRFRAAYKVEMRSHPLTDAEQAEFFARLTQHLGTLAANIAADRCEALRSIPEGAKVLHRLQTWLVAYSADKIAERPNA